MSGDSRRLDYPNSAMKIHRLGRADEKGVEAIVELFADGLGSGYITREKIEGILHAKSSLFLLGCFVDAELVAVQTVSVITETEAQQFEESCKRSGCSVDFAGQKIGMLISVVVKKEFRRMGIGSQMMKEGVKLLEQMGCSRCIATAWNSGLADSSATVLEAVGFRCVTTFEKYWAEESVSLDCECPTCGSPPCECSASFYSKIIG